MKTQQRSSDKPRLGYSLIELLIVLGVLALMAGLSLPALRGPLERSRLRGAGRQMQTTLGKTRSLAIRTGREHWLSYEIEGRAWRIEATPEPTDSADDIGPGSNPLLEPSAEATAISDTQLVREGDLPSGLLFANPVTASAAKEFADLDVALEPSAKKWSEPIRFQPNGRSVNATIRITGTRDFVTEVKLRGLTGIAKTVTRREMKTDELELLSESDGSPAATEPLP